VALLVFAGAALPALRVAMVVHLLVAALLLRQLYRWERQLLQGNGDAPRNRLA
jgi:hypothetical protein